MESNTIGKIKSSMYLSFILSFCTLLMACDPKSNSLRAKGGLSAADSAKINAAKPTLVPEELRTDDVNSLALTGAIELIEAPKALIAILTILKTDKDKRKEIFPNLKVVNESKGSPYKAEISQSQTVDKKNIQSTQVFEIKSGMDEDKVDYNDLQITWTENVKVLNDLKVAQLSISREFDFAVKQSSPDILSIHCKDSKITLRFNSNVLEYQLLADIDFQLDLAPDKDSNLPDTKPDKATLESQFLVKKFKLDKPRFTGPKKELKIPAILMTDEQNIKLMSSTNQVPNRELNSPCLNFESGSLSLGEENILLQTTIEQNKIRLKSATTDLQSCPVASPLDVTKWLQFVKKPEQPVTPKIVEKPTAKRKVTK